MRRFISKEASFYDRAIRRASGWYYFFLFFALAYTAYHLSSEPSPEQFTILAWQVLSLIWYRAAAVFHGMAVD